MNIGELEEIQYHVTLMTTLYGEKWPVSRFYRFTHRKNVQGIRQRGSWVGPQSWSRRSAEKQTAAFQSVTHH